MSKDDETALEAEESLLYSARHGEISVVKALLQAREAGKITLDINCKGKSKTNIGWTPLHLATYFGHREVVEVLLDAGANVDEVNEMGDTALHKASFIGSEELVIMLLNRKSDLYIMNGEGRTAADVSKTRDVRRLLEAAQRADRCEKERSLLNAAKEGRHEDINQLLRSANPPNINCVDALGNTCLHCAAYRGHARVAVLLLQNGIDTTLTNNSGQVALELARDAELREVLSVRPVQRLARTAARFEGPLLKRSRFLGWRPVWAVLQRGVLLYCASRAAAAAGGWRDRRYLDAARPAASATEQAVFTLAFSDGDTHRLAVPPGDNVTAARQAWLTALSEHIAFSEHYLRAGAAPDAALEATEACDDDCKPLGSMQDALTAAGNSLALLETQLRECAAIVAALDGSLAAASSLHHSAFMRFQHACGTGQQALTALRHCAALVTQQQDVDRARLARETERNRVLEEALAALARAHHALEMSVHDECSKVISDVKISIKDKFSALTHALLQGKRQKVAPLAGNQESFFDVYEQSSDEDDTLVTAGLSSPLGALSPWSSPELTRRTPIGSVDGDKTPTNQPVGGVSPQSPGSALSLHTAASGAGAGSEASSRGTLVSFGGHVYRNARKYARTNQFSSQWSV